MIKQIKPLISICVFLTLVFSSCKKESAFDAQSNNNQSQNELKSLISQVKVWHDSTVSSNLSTKVQNGVRAFSVNENDIVPPVVDWDKAYINYDSIDVKSITVPISMNYMNGEKMQLVATKSKNKINAYLIKVTPETTYFENQIELNNYPDFSGSISIYNLKGNRLKKEDFKNGIAVKNFKSKSILSNNTTYDSGPPCEECNLLTVIVYNSKKYQFAEYNYGLIYIDYQQNINLDEFGGGGDVIAGGGNENSFYIDYDYQFPINSDYKTKYPKFTNLVKNMYENSYKVPKLLDWLRSYTMLSDIVLYNALQFNQGPIIVITDLNGSDWGGATRYGHFDSNKKIIEIDRNLVTKYENGIFKNGDAYTIFLAATLLHETVHYGRYITGNYEYDGEYGRAFQLAANYGNFDLLDK